MPGTKRRNKKNRGVGPRGFDILGDAVFKSVVGNGKVSRQ